jgi:hypothetical protein
MSRSDAVAVPDALGPKIDSGKGVGWWNRSAPNIRGMVPNPERPAASVTTWVLALSALTAGSPLWTEHGHDRSSVEVAKVQKEAVIGAADSAAAAAVKVAEINRDAIIQAAKIANPERDPEPKNSLQHRRGIHGTMR